VYKTKSCLSLLLLDAFLAHIFCFVVLSFVDVVSVKKVISVRSFVVNSPSRRNWVVDSCLELVLDKAGQLGLRTKVDEFANDYSFKCL
jgi:hypothetical protein